jgi:hypothetical protein
VRVVVAGREKKEEAKTNAREPLASPFSAGSVGGGGGSPGTAIVFVVLFLFFVDVSLINLSSDTHKNWENSEAMGRASAHSRWTTPGPYREMTRVYQIAAAILYYTNPIKGFLAIVVVLNRHK